MKHARKKIVYDRHTGGFTLMETLIYVAILALTLTTIIVAVIGISRSYANTQAQMRIGRTAAFSLSRMTREIRFADTADTVLSSFGAHPGTLALQMSNPTRTMRFYLDNGTLKFDQDGAYVGNLTPEKVFVSSFVVRHLQVDSSSAIRVELTLDSLGRTGTTSETFYATVVMRGSYTQ